MTCRQTAANRSIMDDDGPRNRSNSLMDFSMLSPNPAPSQALPVASAVSSAGSSTPPSMSYGRNAVVLVCMLFVLREKDCGVIRACISSIIALFLGIAYLMIAWPPLHRPSSIVCIGGALLASVCTHGFKMRGFRLSLCLEGWWLIVMLFSLPSPLSFCFQQIPGNPLAFYCLKWVA